MSMEDFSKKQYVPEECDDGTERLYWKWEGRCPAGNDCMNKSWPKLKKGLWCCGDDGQKVRDMVLNHLTTSPYHQLSESDAQECLEQFEADEEPLMMYSESKEERDAYRTWKGNVEVKLAQPGGGKESISTALRKTTKFAPRAKPATKMLRDAITSIEEATGDADGYDLLDAVAEMADAGSCARLALSSTASANTMSSASWRNVGSSASRSTPPT